MCLIATRFLFVTRLVGGSSFMVQMRMLCDVRVILITLLSKSAFLTFMETQIRGRRHIEVDMYCQDCGYVELCCRVVEVTNKPQWTNAWSESGCFCACDLNVLNPLRHDDNCGILFFKTNGNPDCKVLFDRNLNLLRRKVNYLRYTSAL